MRAGRARLVASAVETVAPVPIGRSGLALVVQQLRCRVWLALERGERGVALAANEAAACRSPWSEAPTAM